MLILPLFLLPVGPSATLQGGRLMREEMEKEGAHWGGGLMVVGKDKKERWGDHGEGLMLRESDGGGGNGDE